MVQLTRNYSIRIYMYKKNVDRFLINCLIQSF